MRRMGFTHHPGALPFVTVRRAQWANRLTIGENIEIHGEHGCDMPPIAAKVVHVSDNVPQHLPPHLVAIYGNQPLCTICLSATDEPWEKIGESWFPVCRQAPGEQPLDFRERLRRRLD